MTSTRPSRLVTGTTYRPAAGPSGSVTGTTHRPAAGPSRSVTGTTYRHAAGPSGSVTAWDYSLTCCRTLQHMPIVRVRQSRCALYKWWCWLWLSVWMDRVVLIKCQSVYYCCFLFVILWTNQKMWWTIFWDILVVCWTTFAFSPCFEHCLTCIGT